ncbi:MAG: ABC transporter ATP-binding protein [Planctomycetes bacterium]|nr:ABC transporter ATP-binding protein [Planctomycetota bacterium]
MSNAGKKEIMRAEALEKAYLMAQHTLSVLRNIDLSVYEGEFLTVLGKSGSGKSTLLHVLGALDRPTGGTVRFRGEDLYALSNHELSRLRSKTFGFVFQFYHLLADFNALENVMLPSLVGGEGEARKGRKERRSRAAELLARVGLEDRATHRPAQLSGGERQRVAVARALMNDPDILFFDEPTGNLDTKTGEAVHDLIVGLNKEEGKTLVLVTHDRELAKKAGRVVHIVDGKITDGDEGTLEREDTG